MVPFGLIPQPERRGQLPGPLAAFPAQSCGIVLGLSHRQGVIAAAGVGVALLALVQIPFVVQPGTGRGLSALGRPQRMSGDVQPLGGRGAGDGRPGQYGFGQSRISRLPSGGGPVATRRTRGLFHAVGQREELLVAGAHPGLGCPPAFGKAFLDRGEAAGVEQSTEELAPGLGVRSQEAGEVALRQQHHLAELFAVHTDQLGDLLTDLLVGTAEGLPCTRGVVVLAQPTLGAIGGETLAALLGAGLGRAPDDLQPPVGDGEFEKNLGGGAGVGVVAAQRCARALTGAGDGSVQGEAHRVEHGGLARAGGSVEQEDARR